MFNPPTGPTNGAEYTYGDVVWQYQNPPGVWNIKDGALVGRNGTGVTGFRIDGSGNLYFQYVYHGGATSNEINLGQVGGGAGIAFDDGITFRDSDDSVASGTRVRLGGNISITGSGTTTRGVRISTTVTANQSIGSGVTGSVYQIFASVPVATTSITGVASFNATDFNVSAGAVTLDTDKAYFDIRDEVGASASFSLVGDDSRGRFKTMTLTGGQGVSVRRGTFGSSKGGEFAIAGITASNTVVGVASFKAGDFSVSSLGQVSLTGGLVYSVNGKTGNVALPLANTSGTTGVASFKSGDFTVSTAGEVSLTSGIVNSIEGLTGALSIIGNNITVLAAGKTLNLSIPLSTDVVKGIASFKAGDFTVASGVVSLTSGLVNTINGGTGNILAGAGDDKIVYTSTTGLTTSPTFMFDGNTLTFGGANTQMTVTGPTFAFGDATRVKGGLFTLFKEFAYTENQTLGGGNLLEIDPRDGTIQKIKGSGANAPIVVTVLSDGWSNVPNAVESIVVYFQQLGTGKTGQFANNIITDRSVTMFGVTGGIDVFTINRCAVTSNTGLTMGFSIAVGLTGSGIAF